MSENTPAPPGLSEATRSRLLDGRVLVLERELEAENGAQLMGDLLMLAAQDPERDITLLIDSPGGLVPAMLAIGDLMDLVPCDVRTVALGMAYSAGQFLLSAGTPGKRYALPHATVLLHQGSSGFGGSAVDISLQAEQLRRNRDVVLGLIAQHTGQSLERVTQDSQRDRIFEADEAKDYGFVDHVVTDLAPILTVTRRHSAGLTGTGSSVQPGNDEGQNR
jgi:ATP-dependent Clp protease protease subunit